MRAIEETITCRCVWRLILLGAPLSLCPCLLSPTLHTSMFASLAVPHSCTSPPPTPHPSPPTPHPPPPTPHNPLTHRVVELQPALGKVRLCPAWKCLCRVEGPSHPGTPTPSMWSCRWVLTRLEMRCKSGQSLTSRHTNPLDVVVQVGVDPPRNASSERRFPHIQAPQPPLQPALQVRLWPAWRCVGRAEGLSHQGTPTPSGGRRRAAVSGAERAGPGGQVGPHTRISNPLTPI